MSTFNLPDVGEGLTEAEIVGWKIAPGDTVAVNDVLVEIETAKSLVELPSPFAGKVQELLVAEGQTVPVGTALITITAAVDDSESSRAASSETSITSEAVENLVGSGPKAEGRRRRRRVPGQAPATTRERSTVTVTESSPEAENSRDKPRPVEATDSVRALATPPVRKAAKDLGIDLNKVPATGKHGEVTRKDLLNFQGRQDATTRQAFWHNEERIERIPVKGVRKATAKAMVESAFSAPHVSIFVDVDASRTMEFVKRLKESRDFEGIKVSPLLIVAKAVIWAAARNPNVNASWTEEEILVKHYMNLGIAAATPRGLMVPNIKDAQDLSLKELAMALNELALTARSGKTSPSDMQDGTLTITNIGALGIDIGTPIINPGEVAIVAFGTIKQKPWVLDGEVIPRWITTLGGSFDHRVVDGDLSARFMADVASVLEEPALLLD